MKRKKVTDMMFATRDGHKFRTFGRLPSPRSGHCAVLLADQKLFVAGGIGGSGQVLEDAAVFDPNDGWTGDQTQNYVIYCHKITLSYHNTQVLGPAFQTCLCLWSAIFRNIAIQLR